MRTILELTIRHDLSYYITEAAEADILHLATKATLDRHAAVISGDDRECKCICHRYLTCEDRACMCTCHIKTAQVAS